MAFTPERDGNTIRRVTATTPARPEGTRKVRWGILGVAKIATEQVIPAMQSGEWSEVTALASRDAGRARAHATALRIPRSHGSYEALIEDPDVEAIYNPLPNHLHVPWSDSGARGRETRALRKAHRSERRRGAGSFKDARDRTGRIVQEAFMVRTHPQWLQARALVREGRIGTLRSIFGYFSYFNRDAGNIRNIAGIGGGALWDIGCYLIHTSRMIFEAEPRRVMGLIERDPDMKIDRLTSLLLDFERGHTAGTCSTQAVAYQRMHLVGTSGRIEIEIPFNAPADRPCRIFVDDGADLSGRGIETIEVPPCNQYTIQGDLFSRAIREGSPAPYPLEDTIANMRVIEAVFRSAATDRWVEP